MKIKGEQHEIARMSIHTILDKDFENMVKGNKFKSCAVVAAMYEDPHILIDAERYLYRNINIREERHSFGKLEIGETRIIDTEIVECLTAVTIPSPQDRKSIDFDTLKKCYINAIQTAYEAGAVEVALPPFYAGSIVYKSDMVHLAAMEAADEFLTKEKVSLVIYVILRTRVNPSELFRQYNSQLQNGMEAFKGANPDDWKDKLDIMKDNIDLLEKSLRIAAKWNDNNINIYQEEIARMKREREELLQDNPHLSKAVYNRDMFVNYINSKVGRGKEYTQLEFADKSNIDVANLNRIIKGNRLNITKDTAVKIALALELKIKDFKNCVLCSGASFPCDEADLEIEKCVKEGIYDIKTVLTRVKQLEKADEEKQ